jgi:predicted  nucleic acid-binding Zn-ribbon protein
VGAQEQRAAALRTSNETARKQIESLTAQIQQLNETIIRQESEAHQIDSEVTVARADLDSKAREFAAAAQFVRDELTAQRASITTTL